ncbi:Carbamoyl-phosphate synthase L chain ATP-binding [Ignisphaera aggregans DSM 17230]|uniref:Carbamoyl-phosphate synthase L chain ATP-binding n=1 Tax=Ignisphaera aggregans (strain DSM 17230 / JCM 13409 / AQ1.S1) TaxID=583356 RepID=E0SNL7_IGNAA|nr:Carbamoyl-phosphate synthase L chain ATP-binding [Ignisphaera aggregans DSM 17230]
MYMVDRIRKLLIANRGEIAIRIIKTCKRLGIKTVAIYTYPDRDSLHVKYADEVYSLGSDPYGYLDVEKIVSIAKRSGVDAVHPGYGFLSERAAFAKAVEDSGIIWIGPPWSVIELLESKSRTRAIASEVGVPVIPGTLEPVSIDIAKRVAEEIGFPILIKADRGGGGRGIRIVNSLEELEHIYEIAIEEMKTAFGSDKVYIEKFIPRARHIELQILADKHGNIVVLGERECSIQRRYQKVIEEAPSPIVTDRDRDYLYELAVKFMRRVGYVNAGTMEFLRDQNGNYYLIEVNKRIQVEHPVTEMVTGIDIVEQQIKIAEGRELEIKNHIKNFNGHAIEARIYAEDPEKMLPSPGTVTFVKFPSIENIRIDHALAPGIVIPPFYDPMIAKVIAWGKTRGEAIDRLVKALREFQIDGIKTSIPLLIRILTTEEFTNGNIDVQFFDRIIKTR